MVIRKTEEHLAFLKKIAFEYFIRFTGAVFGAIGLKAVCPATGSPALTHPVLKAARAHFRLPTMLLCAMGLLFLLGACNRPHKYDWKQTVTITVETPSGTKTASADQYISAKLYDRPMFATTTTLEREHRGDPVILDLGAGNVLFAVQSLSFVISQFSDKDGWRQPYEAATSSPPMEPREVDVPRLPQSIHFFRFKDLADPSSIERVNPNDLAASFGAGFALTEVVVSARAAKIEPAIGRAPELLTGQIDDVLPWLAEYPFRMKLPLPEWPTFGITPLNLRSGLIN